MGSYRKDGEKGGEMERGDWGMREEERKGKNKRGKDWRGEERKEK